MILPDDVLTLISDYSRPLNRRVVSDYWNKPNIKSDNDMISDVITHIALALQSHCWFADSTLRLDISYTDIIHINVWVIEDDDEYLEWHVSFGMYYVLNWKHGDERFHIGLTPYWSEPTRFITQLRTDNGTITRQTRFPACFGPIDRINDKHF